MGFRYALHLQDGEDAGVFESRVCDWGLGDEFIGDGNARWRIVSVIPLPRIEEFVERPTHGAWQVEPLEYPREIHSG